jgi:hypothetical protein
MCEKCTPKWFVEERNLYGSWSPVIYTQDKAPVAKRAMSPSKIFRKSPVLVPEHLMNASTTEVAKALSEA